MVLGESAQLKSNRCLLFASKVLWEVGAVRKSTIVFTHFTFHYCFMPSLEHVFETTPVKLFCWDIICNVHASFEIIVM